MKTKINKTLIITAVIFSLGACNSKSKVEKQTQPKQETVVEKPTSVKESVLTKLDKVLSPFEDMTEFALNKNEKGVKKSLDKVLKYQKESVFKEHLKPESMDLEYEKINTLQTLFEARNYQQIALASTDLFEYNISNLTDADKIPNQIKIEHLDYLGFELLALLDQDKVDWVKMEDVTVNAESVWKELNPNISDNNLVDAFNFLFEGLHLSIQNNDKKMTNILASMDLSLVDVLENSL